MSHSAVAIPTQSAPEIKVAFIGDTEAGAGFGQVLALIRNEATDVVMINGDLGYGSSPSAWKNRLLGILDPNQTLIIGSLGNHDVMGGTKEYITIFNSLRTAKNGLQSRCTGQMNVKEGLDIVAADEVCTFSNLTIVSNAIGQVLSKPYLEKRLEEKLKAAPADNWKVAGYHFTLDSMNPGLKGDENTHSFFDIIRRYGVIGVQAHTHSVMASCPVASPFQKGKPVECDKNFGQNNGQSLESRYIANGIGLYIDSSLGGKGPRGRGRCKNPVEKDCGHMVDLVTSEGYTRVDGKAITKMSPNGAVFITFNKGGDSSKAEGVYKTVDGKEIFRFTIDR